METDEPPPAADVRAALAAEADDLARRLGLSRAVRERLASSVPLLAPLLPGPHDLLPGDAGAPHRRRPDPHRLGELHQALLGDEHRRRRGVHYTPPEVAAELVGLALAGTTLPAAGGPWCCDPSCGGGAFLLAAVEHLVARRLPPTDALRAVAGIDLDPLAVEVSRAALVLWAVIAGVGGDELVAVAEEVADRVRVGDALRDAWPGEGSLVAVVGNPPFGGQLSRATARDGEASAAARELLGGTSAGYADTAGLFLVRGVNAAPGGRVVLLQPLSFLAARDAGVVRRTLSERAVLEAVWLPGERLFAALVDVCAPVLRAGEPLALPAQTPPVAVRRGPGAELVAEVAPERLARAGTWAPVVAAATGVPAVDLEGRTLLGEWARATAGFRDEFYALAPFVHDRPDLVDGAGATGALPEGLARLVTAGLVEPGWTRWGARTTRLAGRRLAAPVVDLAALRAWSEGPDGDRRLAAWADARLRPKVVVATQTKVVEAAVDHDGAWWPSVPVISVLLDPAHDDERHRRLVLAALSAPPVTAWAAERVGGAALAPQALKLSARQLLEVPLPVDADRWERGAEVLSRVAGAGEVERSALLAEAGMLLTEAHGLGDAVAREVLAWWADRAGCGPWI